MQTAFSPSAPAVNSVPATPVAVDGSPATSPLCAPVLPGAKSPLPSSSVGDVFVTVKPIGMSSLTWTVSDPVAVSLSPSVTVKANTTEEHTSVLQLPDRLVGCLFLHKY